MDSMHVSERFAYYRNNRPCKFNVYCRKDEPGRLLRLNSYCSCRVKPLNGSAAGLNYPAKLVAMLEAKLVFARVTHRESVNNNQTRVVMFFFLVGCLSSAPMTLGTQRALTTQHLVLKSQAWQKSLPVDLVRNVLQNQCSCGKGCVLPIKNQ